MYSFKKYTHSGDFISEIPQKFIKNIPTFHETMNSGQAELSLECFGNISENFLDFGNLVKIFYDGKIIYSGFCMRKENIFSEKKSVVFHLIGIFDILRNYKIYWLKKYLPYEHERSQVEGKALVFFKEMFQILNKESKIFSFDENKISDKSDLINKYISGNFQDLLKYFQKKYNMNFFIGSDGFLKIGKQKNHTLYFDKEIFEIKIENEYSEIINHAEYKAKMQLRDSQRYTDIEEDYVAKDEESIKKFGVKYNRFDEVFFGVVYVEDYEKHKIKAQKHINDILEKAKNPFLNIKLKIFDKKYFGVLNILDTLTIKNFSEEIENKKIVKISYNENYMEVELENYNILGNIILGQ